MYSLFFKNIFKIFIYYSRFLNTFKNYGLGCEKKIYVSQKFLNIYGQKFLNIDYIKKNLEYISNKFLNIIISLHFGCEKKNIYISQKFLNIYGKEFLNIDYIKKNS